MISKEAPIFAVLILLISVSLNHAQVVRATSRETNIGDLVGNSLLVCYGNTFHLWLLMRQGVTFTLGFYTENS
jgi:hypothetical protein